MGVSCQRRMSGPTSTGTATSDVILAARIWVSAVQGI